MAIYLEGRYLKDADAQFAEQFKDEIDKTSEKLKTASVLIFPALLSKFRFLGHKIIEEFYFPELCSFSIGEDDDRRLIIGSSLNLKKFSSPYPCVHKKLYELSKTPVSVDDCICSARWKNLVEDVFETDTRNYINRTDDLKKSHLMKNRDVLRQDDSTSKRVKSKSNVKDKRPDKDLYVPRALRQPKPQPSNDSKKSTIINHSLADNMELGVLSLKEAENTVPECKSDVTDCKEKENKSNSDSIICENIHGKLDTLNPHSNQKSDFGKNGTFEELQLSEKISSKALNFDNPIFKEESIDKCMSSINMEVDALHEVTKPVDLTLDEIEYLNQDIIHKLVDIIGKVHIYAVENDYSEYESGLNSNKKEYQNIIELYDFPVKYTTNDLVSGLSLFPEECFKIKWVDDCHALAVFNSTSHAIEALELQHEFIQVRPISEGIRESREKARWWATRCKPSVPRPQTSAVLARRLVSSALGKPVRTSREQLHMEKNMLEAAKEKKKLKSKS